MLSARPSTTRGCPSVRALTTALVCINVDAVVEMLLPSKVFLEVMNSVLMTGEIPGLFAKDEMMAMTADLRNSFLKVGHVNF